MTIVNGGNQATISTQLVGMKVVSIRKEIAGTVIDLLDPSGKSEIPMFWDCLNAHSDSITMNTLTTAQKMFLPVDVSVEATFKNNGLAVLCLKDVKITNEGLKILLNLKK